MNKPTKAEPAALLKKGTVGKPVARPAAAPPAPTPKASPVRAVQTRPSTAVAPLGQGILARMQQAAKDVAAKETVGGSNISLRGGRMAYQNKPVPGDSMNVVVVGAVFERHFYSGAFDPDRISSPDCFAIAEDEEGMAPHDNSLEKQSEKCADCKLSAWGSDPNGGRGKACKEIRKLAVVPFDSGADADSLRTAEMATVKVPVMSVRNWATYVNDLYTAGGRPPWGVVTRMYVEPDPRSQFRLKFAPVDTIDDEPTLETIETRLGQATSLLLQPYAVKQDEPPPAVAKKAGRKETVASRKY